MHRGLKRWQSARNWHAQKKIHKCCCTIRIICLIYKTFLPSTITVPNFQRWHAKMLKAKLDQVEELSQSCWELIGKLQKVPPKKLLWPNMFLFAKIFFFFLDIYIHCLWMMHFNMTMSHWQKHINMGLKWTLTACNIFNFLLVLYYSLRWCRIWEWHTCLFSCHLTQPPSLESYVCSTTYSMQL